MSLPKLTPNQRKEVAELYLAGNSINGLSKKFKITVKTVKGLLRVRGVELRPYIAPPRRVRKVPLSPRPVHERRATKKLERALKWKWVVRPDHCSVCLKSCKPHGHHDDYNKPLEVRWLCSKCHYDWHTKNIPIPSK